MVEWDTGLITGLIIGLTGGIASRMRRVPWEELSPVRKFARLVFGLTVAALVLALTGLAAYVYYSWNP